MSRRSHSVALGVLLTACRPAASSDRAELDQLEARMGRHERDLDRSEDVVRALEAKWAEVVTEYQTARDAYFGARSEYERASREYASASAKLQVASVTWQRARVRWELATDLIMAAAALDAYNLAAKRGASDVDLEGIDCKPVSTAKFRRHLKAEGIDLTNIDVDHIVPKALGGADHPWNYQLLDSSTNRSLGATWNAEKCAAAGLSICKAAVAVSKLCGAFKT